MFVAFGALCILASAHAQVTDPCQTWGEQSIPYRPAPIKDPQGNDRYLGWKPQYQYCETNSYSSGTLGAPGSDAKWASFFNYNYAWNAEVGLRSFWAKKENGNLKSIAFGKACPYGYERSTWFTGAHCRIPKTTKFLGETCTAKSQCVNGFTSPHVDTTCSPLSPDPKAPWKCVFDEESGGGISLDNNICSCFGLLWCESDDCKGSQCVLSTYDGKKHCQFADESFLANTWLGSGACSNCRTDKNACKAFNGGSAAKTDTSQIGVQAGVVGLGAVVLLGAGYTVRRITQRRRDLVNKTQKALEEKEMLPVTGNTNPGFDANVL